MDNDNVNNGHDGNKCIQTLSQKEGVTALSIGDCDAEDPALRQTLLIGCEVC